MEVFVLRRRCCALRPRTTSWCWTRGAPCGKLGATTGCAEFWMRAPSRPASRRSTTGKGKDAPRPSIYCRVLLLEDGASWVVRANSVSKFVELLGEDPDDRTETAANDCSATARVVEGLATDGKRRADALVSGRAAAAEARGC